MPGRKPFASVFALMVCVAAMSGCYSISADMSKEQILRAAEREFPKGIDPEEVTRRCGRLSIAVGPLQSVEETPGLKQGVMHGSLPRRRRIPLLEWGVPMADLRFLFNGSRELTSMTVVKGGISL